VKTERGTSNDSVTFYLDFISPYAYLAFHAIPQALEGLSVQVQYQPILFGALLKHHGHRGPAEIAGKREWTYRQVLWLARQQGCTLRLPSRHPFNPLALLRLVVATNPWGGATREVCQQAFEMVWAGGGEPEDADRLHALRTELNPTVDPNSDSVKHRLRDATNAAIAAGVFGVPTFVVRGKHFWGQDALPMLRDYLLGGRWFQSGAWEDCADLPVGVRRDLRS
jgi:2-hydroxychromene-2-carboxylate isomerase